MIHLTDEVERLLRRPRPAQTLDRFDRARAVRRWARQVTRQRDESVARLAAIRERVTR